MKNAALRIRTLFAAPVLLVLSAALSSCGGLLPQEPTPTWTPDYTPTPTATFTPTPTLSYTEWPVAITETFDEEKADWPVGDINNEFAKGSMIVEGGKYHIKLTAKKPYYWFTFPEMNDLSDVYASVKVDQMLGTKTAEYGIIVRGSEGVHYFYSIGSLQQGYELTHLTSDDGSTLTLWTHSSRILIGEPNVIGIKAEGPKFTLYINGEQVDDALDPAPAPGKVGIGIVLMKAGDTIDITFDNFEVRTPAGS